MTSPAAQHTHREGLDCPQLAGGLIGVSPAGCMYESKLVTVHLNSVLCLPHHVQLVVKQAQPRPTMSASGHPGVPH